jgi:hypothetical protein
MYILLLGLAVFLGGIPLIALVRKMTRNRPAERYERRAWMVALLSAIATLMWTIIRILRAFSDAASPSAEPMMEVLVRVVIVVIVATGLPALVALTLTVIATRRHRQARSGGHPQR